MKVCLNEHQTDFQAYLHVLFWCFQEVLGGRPGAAAWAAAAAARWRAAAARLTTTAPQQISHLCHRPDCVSYEHLSREPARVNDERRQCVLAGTCGGHGMYPDCLL